MRQIADVQPITTDKIEVVDDDEADAGWVSELGTRSDSGTPQVRKYEIQAHEMYAMPKVSQKLIDDAAVDVEGWLAGKVADKFARVEGTAFWQGTGVGQPRGLCSYTTAATADGSRAWGQFEHINTGANGAFHTTQFDPIHDLMGAIKDHFLPNAQFVMRREVRSPLSRKLKSTTNRYLGARHAGRCAGAPERLRSASTSTCRHWPRFAVAGIR